MSTEASLHLNHTLDILPEVSLALRSGQPIVALESAVITHGLPRPKNVELAAQLETEIRSHKVVPATVAVLKGRVKIGLTAEELEELGSGRNTSRKVSHRDFGIAIAKGLYGGTTVAGTLVAAHIAGIKVFATGGIGGVHRGSHLDISADLIELSRRPVVVVCAGAKAILDLPATVEYLETVGVPIIGFQTEEFPAFYSRESGIKVTAVVDTPAEAAKIARAQWSMGLTNSILVVNPPPQEFALPYDQIDKHIQKAVQLAEESQMVGADVTPFLLNKVAELSGGSSLQANLALLRSNSILAAQIAREIAEKPATHSI